MSALSSYLGIGAALAAIFAWLTIGKYRARVWRPAAQLHGRGQVAVAEDIGTLAGLGALVLVAWLPLGLVYAYIRATRALGGRRARENNPTPTL